MQLIADELNVKEVELHSDEGEICPVDGQAQFPCVGKKNRQTDARSAKSDAGFDRKQIQTLAAGHTLKVEIGGESVELEPDDVQIERKVKEGLAAGNEGELTVALDTALE